MARTENQDFFGYWEPDDDRLFDLKGRLVVVCDGMGGHSGGEIASRMAVKSIIDNYEQDSNENIAEALRQCIETANATVYGEGLRQQELKGMGTTVTAVVQRRDMVFFGQVGDSRAYLIRGGNMKQMTKDHSLVQQLVDEGLLEASEMENHPDKNVILRSLGVKPEVEVDVSHMPIADGDIFLLCSDGLSGLITDEQMLDAVKAGLATNGGTLRKICETLVDMANAAGGHDNITVQMLKVKTTTTATTDSTPQETVTAQFTAEEVEASIAAARAARGDAPPLATAAPGSGSGPVLPVTAPSMPVPQAIEPPKQGGGWAKLVVGLIVGVLLGVVVMTVFHSSARKGAARAAHSEATEAKGKATAKGVALSLAKKQLELGEGALKNGEYDKAQAHFKAAAALFTAGSE